MECRHNLGYWERKNYLGLGLGASSLLDNRRYSNTENLREYTECAGQPEDQKNTEHLTEEEQMEEFIFRTSEDEWHFRTGFWNCFQKQFGTMLRRKYQESHGKRFVKATGRLFKSDKKNHDVSNYVFAEILYQ